MINSQGVLAMTVLLMLSTGCSTQVLRPDLKDQISKAPQLVDFHDRWILGFARKTYTDPQKACLNQTPVVVKDVTSTEDILIGLFTFGIYLPVSTQVWCVQEEVEKSQPKEI